MQHPKQVQQVVVPQTKVHVSQPQVQVQRQPVQQIVNGQTNQIVIPSNKVNIGFNQQSQQSRQITSQSLQGRVQSVQHQHQTPVLAQVQPQQVIQQQGLTKELIRPLAVV